MDTIESKLSEIFQKTRSITIKAKANICIIENNRKSRFIMQDARNLLKKIEDAKVIIDKNIEFHSLSPICSKSINYLKEKGVTVRVNKKSG